MLGPRKFAHYHEIKCALCNKEYFWRDIENYIAETYCSLMGGSGNISNAYISVERIRDWVIDIVYTFIENGEKVHRHT